MRLALFIILAGLAFAAGASAETPKSRVVLVRDTGAVDGFNIDTVKVRSLLATGLKALTGQTNEVAAWRQFVSSNDIVGIKVSTQAAPLHATHREVVAAIAAGLIEAGVAPTNIVVWDRDPGKLRAVGYRDGWRTAAVIGETGWDVDAFYENGLVGKLIWGDRLFGQADDLSTRSHLPNLLTRTITKLINVPVLLDHDACGLAGCLYNVSLGAVDNGRRFEQAGQRGEPAISEICALPAVRRVLALNIMDALIGGYAGGPQFKPQYSWPQAGLYLSRDAAAIDALCLELLEAKRREASVPAISNSASHIAAASALGLGQAQRDQIELVETAP